MDKLASLAEAIGTIPNGATVALGGNVLHRAPMAAVRELARQQKRDLHIVKTAGAMDIDLLCLAGCVAAVSAGFVSYESEYGLARHYRRAVESGAVKAHEHACYTVISALRAAAAGVDFMPVAGLVGSQLIEANGYFEQMASPFTGQVTTVVRAIRPDFALVHVEKADRAGNALVPSPGFEDLLLTRSGAKVILTAETIVEDGYFTAAPQKADIPHFLAEAVVHCPGGAAPCSCGGAYDIDPAHLARFLAVQDEAGLAGYLAVTSREVGV